MTKNQPDQDALDHILGLCDCPSSDKDCFYWKECDEREFADIQKAAIQAYIDKEYISKKRLEALLKDEEVSELEAASWNDMRRQAAALGRNQLRAELRKELEL